MKLHGQWLARWSGHGSTIVTRSFTERPLETLVGFRGWSTRWRRWSRVPGSVITSRQFWLIYTGFQSRPGFDSKLPYRHTKHSPRRNWSILPIYSVSRLHRDHSGQAQRTVFMLTLLEPASPVELFVMWRRLFGTLFPLTWLTFHNLWILSKNSSKHSYTVRHTVTDSPPRPRLRFNLFIFNMFSLTYGESPAVYYYYYYLEGILERSWDVRWAKIRLRISKIIHVVVDLL